jgi:excisionase family DNA binding protein
VELVRQLRAERDWLTAAEVASMLQVCRATVYALIKRGELRATRVGLSLCVHAASLAAFLSS